ncbi:MAG: ABC-type bacteriocin/lantibiotic exporter with double-glycine peptidase domain [Crocinitomicaceae bacterium]|jgi:ABC-type bacteriocin/lantibiotic exporter with double-glycine peptidase domain
MIVFKVLVAVGLLLIGGLLVIDQQMNIGQFVAAEIVILLIVNSVEKVILSFETIYDVLTSLEKIGQVMDLELEKDGGMAPQQSDQGIQLELMNISYKYPQEQRFIIDNLSLKIKPNNRVLITGRNDSGKSTLLYLVGGLLNPSDGSISIDGIPSKNYEYDQLRNQIGGYLRDETLFEGTLLENITLGMEGASLDNVKWAIENLNLARTIRQLGDGYHTRIYPQGKQFSKSTVAKILLARAIINKPRLLLLENSFSVFSAEDRLNILNFLLSREQQWTVLVSSSQPINIPELIDQEIILKGGKIINN